MASGDNGSSDGVDDGADHVDFPASSPYCLACGGTNLHASGGAITSETVWNDGANGGATGGGVSGFFALPPYQEGLNVTQTGDQDPTPAEPTPEPNSTPPPGGEPDPAEEG